MYGSRPARKPQSVPNHRSDVEEKRAARKAERRQLYGDKIETPTIEMLTYGKPKLNGVPIAQRAGISHKLKVDRKQHYCHSVNCRGCDKCRDPDTGEFYYRADYERDHSNVDPLHAFLEQGDDSVDAKFKLECDNYEFERESHEKTFYDKRKALIEKKQAPNSTASKSLRTRIQAE